MDDQTLIKKYNLSESMLPKVFNQLISAGHITQRDIDSRNIFDSTQKVAELFSFPADELD